MAGIHTLSDVKEYLQDNSFSITDDRIKKCYDLIPNPEVRVNSDDKQWVACVTQDFEEQTTIDAIAKIFSKDRDLLTDEDIKEQAEEVCKIFKRKEISHKPRIPFYVLMIDRIIK
ncbi:hypothetical protein [Aliarcobacter skirrowii]|uniref:Uncharacterized protein n=1 Tax=Aliarcobacter skirrowii TaxID=28200 RepID=A0AAW9DA92_9BACT|nr:hypothetical protein [Aliarcobacter skirrowii]MDX4069134.1 hypothetical protein [Aliarcobacter skirrowii]